MKLKLHHLSTVVAIFLCSVSHAQSYIGQTLDHYSGIQGIIYNPSFVVDSKQRADINILSISAFGGSDYFSMDIDGILDSEDGFNISDGLVETPKIDNQFFLNVDILGPSFMFNLSKRSSIGITSRARTFLNFNNLNGTLYENLTESFGDNQNFNFELQNFSGTIHAWAEVGLTYGRVLVNNNSSFLKGGFTLKYLQGAGSTFVNAPSATGQYDMASQLLTTAGNFNYGYTLGFDPDNIEFSNVSSGFGGDVGFTYEYRPRVAYDSIGRNYSNYKLRTGISITDIGSISYDDSNVTSYDLDNTIDKEEFEGRGTREVLEENYQGIEEVITSKINLPTAMHLFMDYKMKKYLYLGLQGSLSLIGDDQEQANRIINTLTATPRFQSRWFSFYLPVSLRQYDGFAMGAGLRLGPLSVGSGSVISNYLGDSSQTTDIYAGLKIPIYR